MKTIIILFLAAGVNFSQITPEWTAKYNGTGNSIDQSRYIAVDRSGYVYVTGKSRPETSGTTFDFVTIKYDPQGIELWVQRYNGPANSDDTPNSIAVDLNGNVYVAGGSRGTGTGYDYAVLKYSTTGNQLWIARYSTTVDDVAYSVAVDNSENVFVTGKGYGAFDDYVTIKYNSSGVQQWLQRYNGTANWDDAAYAIVLDEAGNVFVTGFSKGSNSGSDIATVKYSNSGVQQWIHRYAGPATAGVDIGYDLALDNSGNTYVTGYSDGVTGLEDFITIKINPTGSEVWAKRYNGPGNNTDIANSISVDPAGNIYVTGSSKGSNLLGDFATVKYNSAGDQVWLQRYNGTMDHIDEAKSIIVDSTGGVYVTGVSRNNSTGNDITTIKYNYDGIQQWIAIFNGTATSNDDFGESIALDHMGNVYVTGYFSYSSSYDYITLKYSQPIGINQLSNEIPSAFRLDQNYPNPFNPVTNIRFAVAKTGLVTLKVYDISGREVALLVNEELSAGIFNFDFNASYLASGIYFYKLINKNYTDTKKMVLVK